MPITAHNTVNNPSLKPLQDLRDSLIQLHMKAKANGDKLEPELEGICLRILRLIDDMKKPVMPITEPNTPSLGEVKFLKFFNMMLELSVYEPHQDEETFENIVRELFDDLVKDSDYFDSLYDRMTEEQKAEIEKYVDEKMVKYGYVEPKKPKKLKTVMPITKKPT